MSAVAASPRRVLLQAVLAAAVASGLAPVLAAGDAAPAQASGKFAGRHKSFAVAGAYAYWKRSPSDSEPLIEVAVSNDEFKASAFDGFYDPRPVISDRFADDETAVVYFEFEPGGKYHGLSFYLGSGDGCGFCYDSQVRSTVRVQGDRLAGRLTHKTEGHEFDIQLDVPVAPRQWGKPLSGDGGEIGAAYRAYAAAMAKGDRKAVFDLTNAADQETWKKREKEGRGDARWNYLVDKIHWNLKEARVTGGYTRENQAVLLIRGKTPYIDHVHGQVTMVREKGRWKVGDEVLEVGE